MGAEKYLKDLYSIQNKLVKKITRIKKNKDGSISHVRVAGEGLVSKVDIIRRIDNGEKFETSPSNGQTGSEVHVVGDKNLPIKDRYIRSDGNPIKEDNLGELEVEE